MIILSSDSKYLFNVQSNKIKVQNIASGETVFDLSYESKAIESICLNPLNRYQLLSCHTGGYICLWDYEDGILLKYYKTTLSIKKLISTNAKSQSLFALVHDEDKTYSFYRIDFSKSNDDLHKTLVLGNIELSTSSLSVEINQKETFVAFIQSKKNICVYDIAKKSLKKHHTRNELTCLTIHPNEDCIATGTTCGKILMWYNFLNDDDQKPPKTTLHWHCLPVLTLCFTQEGSHLLSGGHECVLVKWTCKTSHKDFKPRLGSQIKEIKCSKDNTIYALEHLDNTFHIINSSNYTILQTFTSFTKPFNLTKNGFPTGLNHFKPFDCIVTNSKPGHLQFYQPSTDKMLFHLDTVEENYISPENLDRPKIHTEIEHVAFSYDNTWMATVERRDDQETTPEIKLKFWHFNTQSSKFTLNTLIRLPHSFYKINKIKFHPKENLLVTTGDDLFFKTWILLDESWVYDTCNAYRNMIPYDIDFSLSSKLMSISFGHIATIWSSDDINLFNELINCDPNDHIKQVIFDGEDNLLCAHEKTLNVWCLKSGLCSWSSNIQIARFERHPVNYSILAFKCASNQVEISRVNIQEKMLDFVKKIDVSLDEPLTLICLAKSDEDTLLEQQQQQELQIENEFQHNLNIYYCDSRKQLQRFNTSNRFDDISLTKLNNKLMKNLPTNSLASIFSHHKSQKFVDSTSRVLDNFSTQEHIKKINSTPAYLLPKVSSFGYDILRTMLGDRKVNADKIAVNGDIEMNEECEEAHQDVYKNDESSDEEEERKENTKKQNGLQKNYHELDSNQYEKYNDILKKYTLDDFLFNFNK